MLYDPRETSVGGIHAMFIVRGDPEAYNLPAQPEVPTIYLRDGWRSAAAAAIVAVAGTALAFLARVERVAAAARIMTTTYYDVPLLKPPVWTWEVPLYFFVGGAAGGAAIIGSVARVDRHRRHAGARRAMDRRRRRTAVGGAADRGPRPARTVPQHAARLQAAERDVGRIVDAGARSRRASDRRARAAVVRGGRAGQRALGAGMLTYTGVLIGATAIPVWNENVALLPMHFAASGIGVGGSDAHAARATTSRR